MTAGIIGLIVLLILILAVMGVVYCAYRTIRRKVRAFSLKAFRTPDLASVIHTLQVPDQESDNTPKSVSAATSIFLPQIMKDFPDFHFDEMKRRAENVLLSYLRAIDELDASRLTEGTEEFREKLNMKIEMLKESGKRESYRDILIHKTEITVYRKNKGRCSVMFQSAVQYHYQELDNGRIIDGGSGVLRQSRYNIELLYIQDRELIEKSGGTGMAMVCPNCGAPLPERGAAKCAYCDSLLMEFNIRTWNFSSVDQA